MDLALLQRTSLFAGMEPGEIRQVLEQSGALVRQYGRGAFLWQQGESVQRLGIVLSGTVDAVRYHRGGRAEAVGRQQQGGVFGDLVAAAGAPSPVSLQAAEPATVLLLPLEALMAGEGPAMARLRQNLLREVAEKFWLLRRRTAYLTEPSLRRRLELYLGDCRQRWGNPFTIPYNRQELADFLGVNRSALSRELGRMQRQGLVRFQRSRFWMPE